MENILTEARKFVNADAGSIYIKEKNILHFSYTQNQTLCKRLKNNEKLVYSTFSMVINEHSIAGYVASHDRILNIADVYDIDLLTPYSFSKQYDDEANYKTTSMLTIPLKTHKGKILGVLQIINAQDEGRKVIPFSKKDEKLMMNFAGTAATALERAQMTRAIILRMIKMAEMRDPKETGAHVNRVGGYALEIYEAWAKKNKLSKTEINNNRDVLRMASMLHDVGKIAISDVILKKPGRFNKEEYNIMTSHCLCGAQLFSDRQSDFDDAAAEVALTHHEKWDGTGYPGHVDVTTGKPLPGYELPNGKAKGKKGEEIPLFGRIVALADVYDALCSSRIYKNAWDETKVLETIEKDSGIHFDPQLVEIFFSRIDAIQTIKARYQDKQDNP
ncbi:MAG: HD domain-containing protein [Desulfobacteraceae bacterium]|nr:HD domain-containing protein [Desulfobacteraceae bacterium]